MTDRPTVNVTEHVQTAVVPSVVPPHRLQTPLVHQVDDVLDDATVRDLAHFLTHQEANMRKLPPRRVSPNPDFGWCLPGFGDHAPALAGKVRSVVLQHLDDDVLAAIGVAPFDLTAFSVEPLLFHHGGFEQWGDDAADPEVRVVVEIVLRTVDEVMFHGGDLEFLGGSFPPVARQLTFRHPVQPCRVAPVTCWSADMLHGRWSLRGYLYGPAPDGYVEAVERLR